MSFSEILMSSQVGFIYLAPNHNSSSQDSFHIVERHSKYVNVKVVPGKAPGETVDTSYIIQDEPSQMNYTQQTLKSLLSEFCTKCSQVGQF